MHVASQFSLGAQDQVQRPHPAVRGQSSCKGAVSGSSKSQWLKAQFDLRYKFILEAVTNKFVVPITDKNIADMFTKSPTIEALRTARSLA
jgi:hypothetical protein